MSPADGRRPADGGARALDSDCGPRLPGAGKRIGILLAAFDRVPSAKGASQHVLANHAILRERHDVSLLTLGDAPIPGVRHLAIGLREPNWLLRALAFRERVEAVLAANAFDVHHVRSPWEGLAVPYGRTVVYEVNGLYSIETPYHHPRLIERPAIRQKLRTLELALLDRSALVITPSPVTAAYLEDLGVEPSRIAVVPNRPSFGPVERPPRDEAGPVRLCYVGTLTAWQGVGDLVRALAPLADRPFELSFVTSGRDRRWLEKQLARHGLAERSRFVDPMPAEALGRFLATQDVGLAPLTSCERNLVQGCMPIKLLDYLAAGLAVVAPDMPVVRHVMGDDAPLVRRHSRVALTDAIEALIASPERCRSLGEAARDRVWTRFGPEVQRSALLGAYERLLGEGTCVGSA